MLYENERLDVVNENLSLIQKTTGLTFGTDALLLAAYIDGRRGCAVEFGTGSGIVSLLLLARDKAAHVFAYEVQPQYAALAARNAALNRLDDRMTVIEGDLRADTTQIPPADLVFSNPPYMRSDGGYENRCDEKNIARHEVLGTIDDFCKAAASRLKYGGTFAVVYRPDRMVDLLCAMRRWGIEPKRATLVSADEGAMPSMMLVEGRLGGKPDLFLTRPLLLHPNKAHDTYSADMQYILENGRFPPSFSRKNHPKKR